MTGLWRLVLDTNAVLSSLLFASGRLAPLRVAWQEARFRPIVSAATTKELARALGYSKFRLSATE
jgi:predicted nucleic acid-binding protein